MRTDIDKAYKKYIIYCIYIILYIYIKLYKLYIKLYNLYIVYIYIYTHINTYIYKIYSAMLARRPPQLLIAF